MNNIKRKFTLGFAVVVITACAAGLTAQFTMYDQPDMRIVRRIITTLIIYILFVVRVNRRYFPFLNRRIYERTYAAYLGRAFESDKKSLRLLFKAIGAYNTDNCRKAIGYLYQLEPVCVTADDFGAVYFFLALCFEDMELEDNAVDSYEKLLSYKPMHSMGLSNLGLIYQKKGDNKMAEMLYEKAINADPKNAYAYSNLANHCLRMGEAERTLENAENAIALDPNINAAISAAAVACKLLGDIEKAEAYCEMYGKHGGKISDLRKIIEDTRIL